LDLDILYSDPDPEWNLLWVENNGFATFVPMPKGFAGFPAGSRVRAEGELIPAKGLSLDNARFTVLPGTSRVVPVQATGQLADADRLVNRLVTLEAVVDRQSEPDTSHLMLEASAEGLPVIVRVRVAPGGSRPNLEGMVIRATGVYVGHRNFSGALASVALWVRGLEAIESLAPLAEDTSFTSPVVRIERIAATDASRPVHIVGTVHAFDNTAATVTLRDATGQIVVSTAQRRGIRVGATLEAIGFPEVAGVNRFLRGARVRLLPALPLDAPLPGPGETGEPLRLADQVLALKPADADRALRRSFSASPRGWTPTARRCSCRTRPAVSRSARPRARAVSAGASLHGAHRGAYRARLVRAAGRGRLRGLEQSAGLARTAPRHA
jgi:hypothetical protein